MLYAVYASYVAIYVLMRVGRGPLINVSPGPPTSLIHMNVMMQKIEPNKEYLFTFRVSNNEGEIIYSFVSKIKLIHFRYSEYILAYSCTSCKDTLNGRQIFIT